MANKKPLSFSMAGGTNEMGRNQVYNPGSIKEILKRSFDWNEDTLNDYKDNRTNEKIFPFTNTRQTLMFTGTEIGRELHEDIHVINHIENTINKINNGEKIKPIVCVIGYAGHGKDWQLKSLEGDFSITGDIRFPNELKYILIVNKYFNEPQKLKEELLKLVNNFTFDPELLLIKTYHYILGNGKEKITNDIIKTIAFEHVTTIEGFIEVYNRFKEDNKEMPTLNEILYSMSFTKNNNVESTFSHILIETLKNTRIKIEEKAKKEGSYNIDFENLSFDFDLFEFDENFFHFEYYLDENSDIQVNFNPDSYEVDKEGKIKKISYFEDNDFDLLSYYLDKPQNDYFLNLDKFVKLREETMKTFDNKINLFNPNAKYINGKKRSNINMDENDWNNLESNFIYFIFKTFETPKKTKAKNLEELESLLINHHLNHVWNDGFGSTKENYKKEIEVAFSNLKNIFSEDLNGLNNVEKVNKFISILNQYGLTRSNPKHASEMLPDTLRKKGINPIKITPFSKEGFSLKKEVEKKIENSINNSENHINKK